MGSKTATIPQAEIDKQFNTVLTTVSREVRERDVKNLLCNAFEGGMANSWCGVERYEYAKGLKESDFTADDKTGLIGKFQEPDQRGHGSYFHPVQIIPLVPGCAVIIKDVSGEGDDKAEYRLDREAVIKGLKIFAEVCTRHYNDWITENDDAITGDVFLQCCIFPEQVIKGKGAVYG